ncbi:unnamed protein product [Brugia timori]|uniref:BON domain-containing protein n=1 Tax=Brugia timori TaxID=42155 RepID=A0A0R3Q7J6_9BILA|nr:unnamed protein product [Brugia timori]
MAFFTLTLKTNKLVIIGKAYLTDEKRNEALKMAIHINIKEHTCSGAHVACVDVSQYALSTGKD